jgi:putative transposase
MLSMAGRVTMRGLSRWTTKGGRYRTLQRFFSTPLSWLTLQWVLMRHHLLDPGETILVGPRLMRTTPSGQYTLALRC